MMSLFRSGAVLIVSILLLEVSRTRAKPGIGLPDNRSEETKTKLTWSYYQNYWSAINVNAEIKKAFDFWENHTRFTFEEVPSGDSPANIRILNYWDHEASYFHFTEDNKRIIEVARTTYNPKEPSGVVSLTGYVTWKDYSVWNKNALNISSVVKHQLGYILGQKDTAVFSSIITPVYQITNTSNLTKEEKDSYFPNIEVKDLMTVIKEFYKMPQDICIPKINGQQYSTDFVVGCFIGKYVYDIRDDKVAAVRDYWPQLPENLTKIDGAYADARGFEVFFIGNQAYAIKNHELFDVPAYILNNWLKGEGVDHIDYVLLHGGGVYILKGKRCWSFDQVSNDNYTVREVRVDFFSTPYKRVVVEGRNVVLEWGLEDQVTLGWLDFACQPGQKGLVPPECCNL